MVEVDSNEEESYTTDEQGLVNYIKALTRKYATNHPFLNEEDLAQEVYVEWMKLAIKYADQPAEIFVRILKRALKLHILTLLRDSSKELDVLEFTEAYGIQVEYSEEDAIEIELLLYLKDRLSSEAYEICFLFLNPDDDVLAIALADQKKREVLSYKKNRNTIKINNAVVKRRLKMSKRRYKECLSEIRLTISEYIKKTEEIKVMPKKTKVEEVEEVEKEEEVEEAAEAKTPPLGEEAVATTDIDTDDEDVCFGKHYDTSSPDCSACLDKDPCKTAVDAAVGKKPKAPKAPKPPKEPKVPKEKKPREHGIKDRALELLKDPDMQDKTNDELAQIIVGEFGSKTTGPCIAWYYNKFKESEGLLPRSSKRGRKKDDMPVSRKPKMATAPEPEPDPDEDIEFEEDTEDEDSE